MSRTLGRYVRHSWTLGAARRDLTHARHGKSVPRRPAYQSPVFASGAPLSRRFFRNTNLKLAEHPSADDWPEHAFSKTAEHTLEALCDEIGAQGDDLLDGFDIELSMGVLTIKLGEDHGTYVLNTQTPNRQLWLSSPKSGPARYYWHFPSSEWKSTRDDHGLRQKLSDELGSHGIQVTLTENETA